MNKVNDLIDHCLNMYKFAEKDIQFTSRMLVLSMLMNLRSKTLYGQLKEIQRKTLTESDERYIWGVLVETI